MGFQLLSLLVEVGTLDILLRAHGYVFARGHRHRSGHRGRHGSREHEASRGSRGDHTDCNAGNRNNPVIGAEYSGPKPAGPLHTVTNSRRISLAGGFSRGVRTLE